MEKLLKRIWEWFLREIASDYPCKVGFLGFLGALIGGVAKAVVGSSFLGGIAKTAVGSIIGGAIDRSNAKKEYEMQRGLGFTHSEIAGAGGVNASGNAETVMGNQVTQFQAQEKAQQYEMEQRNLDRMVALSGQETQLKTAQMNASATVQAARASAGASMYGADVQERIAQGRLALEQNRFNQLQLPQGLNDIATSTPAWKRQELLATMGVDNVIATTIAGASGIDIMDPNTLKGMSDAEFQALMIKIYGLQSTVFRETAGSATIINNNLQNLGNTASGFKDWLFGTPTTMQ